jgi:hypothetical protein
MKRKMLVVLAVVAVLTATAATPATAGGALHGDIDLTLYLTPCDDTDPESPLLSWAGTFDIGRKTFGAAYFPASDLVELGEGWVYFEEVWTIFWLPRGELTDKKLVAAACNPRRVVLEGVDAGFGTPWGTAFGAGEVTYGRGHFNKLVGGETFWMGEYTSELGDTFSSTLWIFRPDPD